MANLIQGCEARLGRAHYGELKLVYGFLLAVLVLLLSRASAEPIITRIGDPVFTPVDFVQFSGPNRSPEDFDAVAASIFSDHQLYPVPSTSFRLGPGEPHAPPYDMEANLGVENEGFKVKDVFTLDEFTQPNATFLMYQLVANEDAPRGPSPDFPDGPVIPEDIFPIRWTRGIVINGDQFIDGPRTSHIVPLSDEGAAIDVDGNAVDFTGLNWSHLPFVGTHFITPDFPKALAVTDYEWRDTFRDRNGNGWDIAVPYTVVERSDDLQPGDADQDLNFDQLDLVQVQVAAKYLSGEVATWGEGDWDGAPGGTAGNPPAGNGLFDQADVIAALGASTYLTGPYAAVQADGTIGDGQTSVVFNADTGEIAVDVPTGAELTSINIDSASGIFTGEAAANLGGSFDNDADNNVFKATFGSSFGSLSFGNVARAGLSEEFVLGDLSVIGSLAGGGDLGNVDLVYVPEPSTLAMLVFGTLLGLRRFSA